MTTENENFSIETETILEPLEVTDKEDISKVEVKGSISRWIPENVDEVADEIASIISEYLPIPKNIISGVIRTTLLTEWDISVEYTNPLEDEGRYGARATLGLPLQFEIPLIGEKNYWVEVDTDFVIEGLEVVEANMDFTSFRIEEVDEQEIEPEQPDGVVTMLILPLSENNRVYHYRTVLEEQNGVEIQITSLTREFIETGYVWTGGRDYLIDHVGSFTIPANGKLEWETSFDLSEVESYFDENGKVTYREGWYGTDAEGNPIGVVFSISTSEF